MRILSLIGIIVCAVLSVSLHAAEPPKKPKTKTAKATSAVGPTYAKRKDVAQWADKMAQDYQLDPKWVKSQLAQARFIPSVTKLILPPPKSIKKIGPPTKPGS
jgi:membrane-bound lytic murein transglycosylase B